jgi:hypothetical protein
VNPATIVMIPPWLHILATASLVLGLIGAVVVAIDELRHPQHMWIMNLVWPLTALFASALGLWGYFAYGRADVHKQAEPDREHEHHPSEIKQTPVTVAKATTHCGAGCCLGDILAEWLAFAVPVVATWLGWRTLFSDKMFAVWILDYAFAFVLGIAFQYFTIQPMRKLSPAKGLKLAVKADALSLTAWQVGMYAFMAFAQLFLFRHLLGVRLEVDRPEFWFMMQIAMLAGFATSYPVNWWLLRIGVKEAM